MGTIRTIRLAIVSAFPVLPTSAGGKFRIVQLARALSRLGVEVTIIAPYHPTQTRTLAAREPFLLRQVPYAPFVLPFVLVDRPFPYGCLVSFHPGYRRMLPVSLEAFDLCEIKHPSFTDLTRLVPESVPVVYGSQNVEFDYVRSESAPGMVRRLAGRRLHSLEQRLILRACHVFACTGADRMRFRELYGVAEERVSVLPNGIDLAHVDEVRARHPPSALPGPIRRRAIFVGSDVKHNRQAVDRILKDIAPLFRHEIEFVFLGGCARRIRGRHPANVRLDPQGDLAQYACPGAVGLNPVVSGSGSNLKLLQYLAHDLPVLSTPFGARGNDDLLPWIVTADLESFPDALAGAPTLPTGVRAHLARYEWNTVALHALQVYESLTETARAVG